MVQVVITGGDAVFLRMLQIELEIAGIRAQTYRKIPSPPPEAVLYISPYDDSAGVPLPRLMYSDRETDFGDAHIFRRPFDTADFVSAVKAMVALYESKAEENPRGVIPDSAITLNGNTATYMGRTAALTPREADLLRYLLENRGRPVSREELIRRVWNYDYTGSTNVVDVYIRYLREKLDEKAGIELIATVRGKGYAIK